MPDETWTRTKLVKRWLNFSGKQTKSLISRTTKKPALTNWNLPALTPTLNDRRKTIVRTTPIMADINYIADHIDRIERRHGGNRNLILSSKWRIASHIDLFADLNPNGTLTQQQTEQVDAYIRKFKQTPAGQNAIAVYQRRAG